MFAVFRALTHFIELPLPQARPQAQSRCGLPRQKHECPPRPAPAGRRSCCASCSSPTSSSGHWCRRRRRSGPHRTARCTSCRRCRPRTRRRRSVRRHCARAALPVRRPADARPRTPLCAEVRSVRLLRPEGPPCARGERRVAVRPHRPGVSPLPASLPASIPAAFPFQLGALPNPRLCAAAVPNCAAGVGRCRTTRSWRTSTSR